MCQSTSKDDYCNSQKCFYSDLFTLVHWRGAGKAGEGQCRGLPGIYQEAQSKPAPKPLLPAGYQAGAVSDDRSICDWPGPRDLQPQRKGTSLQAANLFGAVGGGQQDLPWYLEAQRRDLI